MGHSGRRKIVALGLMQRWNFDCISIHFAEDSGIKVENSVVLVSDECIQSCNAVGLVGLTWVGQLSAAEHGLNH